MKFIIVKYHSLYNQDGVCWSISDSVYQSYTARQCGITQQFYDTFDEGKGDLEKMRVYNPGVDYGLVRAQ